MAAKKIGAIIALDGEKQFRQNVTSCNKSLAALKSELQLTKAQYEGQENSLEALTKKHEILSKVLSEQENKEKAIRKALEHANESYEKVGAGLKNLNKQQQEYLASIQNLKSDYDEATKRLQKMTEEGNSSERAIQKQEAVVKSLSEQLKKEEKALEDVNSAIQKGEKNYQSAGNRIKDWETKLNSAQAQIIKANSAVNKNAAYMKEAEQAADKCATSIDKFGKKVEKTNKKMFGFAEGIKNNISGALVDAAKASASQATTAFLDMESAQKQFQASTGATTAEMQRYETVMDNLYKNNYGDDINDVAQAMALVKQYTGEIDPSKLEEMTKNGIAMRDVFDMDLSETIRGVDALVTNMGVSSDKAFDLMAKGAQNGLNKSGELADNIAEYSQLWGQAGFSAEEMFAIMDNGLESGAYNLDKVNDFVKEFSVSLADGRIEKNLESFSSETQELFKQWKEGKATSRDVFYSVIDDLANATNKQEALTLASETWSALGEDNALNVITALANVNTAYENVEGTMEDINSIKYDTLESRIQELGRKFMTDFAVPIAEQALPAIEEGLDFVIDNMDTLIPLIKGAAVGVGVYKGISAAVGLYKTATATATVAQQGLNTAMNANPVMLVTSLVIAAGTALISYGSNAGEASEEVKLLTEENQKLVDSCNQVTEATTDTISEYKNNSEQMQAQAEYADILADKIENLAGQGKLNNEQQQVMAQYIAELNNLVPGLNLAYDEQAQSLSMTNEEISKYIENNQKQMDQQEAMEYAAELIKKRTDLKVEEIKLDSELKGLQEQTNQLKEEEGAIMEAPAFVNWLFMKEDEKKSYDELTEAQENSNKALEDNRAAQENLEQELLEAQELLEGYGISMEDVTAAMQGGTDAANAQTDAMAANAAQQENSAAAAQEAASQIAETYAGIQEQTAQVLESQMNMFEEFNAGTEISKETLLANMQSQIDGVTNWAENMEALADRGINQGILEKLAEMGPQGSSYVAAFIQMSDDELKKAGAMWEESLDMKEGIHDSVADMFEAYTEALNGGKERVASVMDSMGVDTITGLVEGINNNLDKVKKSGEDIGKATTDGSESYLEIGSPSKRFKRIGEYVVQGLVLGIDGASNAVVAAGSTLSNTLIQAAQSQLNQASFVPVGQKVSAGIAAGITVGSPVVLTAAILVSQQVKDTVIKNLVPAQFVKAGSDIPTGMAEGIISGTPQAVAAADSLVTSVVERARNTGSLYSTGLNLSKGMADGIRDGRSAVIIAVTSVCEAAVTTAKEKLQIHSPSKVFERLGAYTSEGFGVGYQKNFENVRRAISKSMEFSNFEQGISGRFNFGIASDSAGEVIIAINNLRKDLNNLPRGNTYNINGLTYDDGSNVSEAVKSLIRASRIERRI